jgi:DnaJ-class molecular chaperone
VILKKRKKYDQYGKDWAQADQFQNARQSRSHHNEGSTGFGDDFNDDSFSSFFESMFGDAGRSGRSRQTKFRGQDYNSELRLSLRMLLILTNKPLASTVKMYGSLFPQVLKMDKSLS